jgi:hypothetical protein
MEDFTLEEYKTLAQIIDATPLQGTIHSLPPALSKLTLIRVKLQRLIEAAEKEYARNEKLQSFVAPGRQSDTGATTSS